METIITGKPTLRTAQKLFMRDGKVRAWHVIEIKLDGKWSLVGDEKDILAFESSHDRDAKMTELLAHSAPGRPSHG